MNKRRVIIADNDQNLLEGIRGLLGTFFDSVVMVADIESLIDAVGRIDADMVVMDLSLGVNQCSDAVKTIKARFPHIKLLVMSMHDDPAAKRKALSAGAEGFVLKREAANDLIPAVKALLSGGRFASTVRSE